MISKTVNDVDELLAAISAISPQDWPWRLQNIYS